MAEREDLVDAAMTLLPPLLDAMDGLRRAGRRLHPPALAEAVAVAAPYRGPLGEALSSFRAQEWPPELKPFRERLLDAAEATLEGHNALADSLTDPDQIRGAYRAVRSVSLASEALYPLAASLRPVSRFFLDEDHRDDAALLDALAAADPARPDRGVLHADNERESRGGFSLYVPETYEPDGRGPAGWPLVIALHGGSGHGRDFLWSWLPAARPAGVILASPTSQGRTWSLAGPDMDSRPLHRMIEQIAENWRVDRSRILVTGMSDGGSFALLSGLAPTVPGTHLAPISASFHPAIVDVAPPERLRGLPIYLTHGALDWMFPVHIARGAVEALRAAGAEVEYREIADLSHTYPSEENARILRWFQGVSLSG